MAHLTEVFFERWEWTFGGHQHRRDDVTFSPTAAGGLAGLAEQVERWHVDIAGLDVEQMWTVGLSQATEIDAQAPFAHLVLHLNRELIHHGSEIAVLRDLYQAQSGG